MNLLRRRYLTGDRSAASSPSEELTDQLRSEADFLRGELRRRDEMHAEEIRRRDLLIVELTKPLSGWVPNRQSESHDQKPTDNKGTSERSKASVWKRLFGKEDGDRGSTREDQDLNRELVKLDLDFFKLFPTPSVTVAIALFAVSQALGLSTQNAVLGTVSLLATLGVALLGAFFVSAFFEDGKHPGTFMFLTRLVTVSLFLASIATFVWTSIEQVLELHL